MKNFPESENDSVRGLRHLYRISHEVGGLLDELVDYLYDGPLTIIFCWKLDWKRISLIVEIGRVESGDAGPSLLRNHLLDPRH